MFVACLGPPELSINQTKQGEGLPILGRKEFAIRLLAKALLCSVESELAIVTASDIGKVLKKEPTVTLSTDIFKEGEEWGFLAGLSLG